MNLTVVFVVVLAVVAYALWRMPDAMPPTVPFGVRVPPEHQGDPAIAAARARYRAVLPAVIAVALAALLAVAVLRRPLAAAGVLLAFLLLAYLAYSAAHRSVAAAKAAGRWYEGRRQGAVADTMLRMQPAPVPWSWLVPAGLIAAATAAVGAAHYGALPATLAVHFGPNGQPDRWAAKGPGTVFLPVLVQVLVTAGMAALAVVIGHTRQDLDPADPEGSGHRHAAFGRVMMRLLAVMAAAMDLTLGGVALGTWQLIPATAALWVVVPTLVGAAYVVVVSLRMGQQGARLSPVPLASTTGLIHRDDDRFWLGGALYVNHDAPAIVVPKRFGVGWTLNFGHPLAWVVVLGLISLPWLLRLLGLGHGYA